MIPVSEPYISKREIDLVAEAVKSGWISSAGKYINEFQHNFASYHNMEHCVALSNGTAALEVALHSIEKKKGDEVIIPSFTIISLPLAIIRFGAIPRLLDVDPISWNITANDLRGVINKKTKAIIVVHGFGHPAEMDTILSLAKDNNIRIIEDTAESIGSKYKGKLCGTFGDVSTFSFYANKLITTGEGGCILTNNEKFANRAKGYINLYFGSKERFSHEDIGFNYRMTNMQAALGVAQLEQISFFIKRKKEIESWYKDALKNCDTVDFQKTVGDVDHIFWMYCVVIKDHINLSANEAMVYLRENGVGTRNLFKGLHLQKPLQDYLISVDKKSKYPVTEKLYKKGFYLPSAITLTKKDISKIVQLLKNLGKNS